MTASHSTRWMLLSALALTVGIGAGLLLTPWTEEILGVMFVLPVIGAAAGASVGGAQQIAGVGGRLQSWPWLAATAAGLAAGLTLGTAAVETILTGALGLQEGVVAADLAALFLIGLCGGGAVGLLQWLLLRREEPASTVGWPVAMAMGLAAGTLIGGALCYAVLGTIRSVAALLLISLCAGAAWGMAAAWRWRAVASAAA